MSLGGRVSENKAISTVARFVQHYREMGLQKSMMGCIQFGTFKRGLNV